MVRGAFKQAHTLVHGTLGIVVLALASSTTRISIRVVMTTVIGQHPLGHPLHHHVHHRQDQRQS